MVIDLGRNGLTVGELLKFIREHNLPQDGKVLVERVEDVYFEKRNWKTVDVEGYQYVLAMERKNKAKNGGFDNKEQYPKLSEEAIKAMAEEDIAYTKEQFIISHATGKYGENNLLICCHY